MSELITDNYFEMKEMEELKAKAEMYESIGEFDKAREVDEVLLSLAQEPDQAPYQGQTYGNPTPGPVADPAQQVKVKRKMSLHQLHRTYLMTLQDMGKKLQKMTSDAEAITAAHQMDDGRGGVITEGLNSSELTILNFIANNTKYLGALMWQALAGGDVEPAEQAADDDGDDDK